MSPLGRLPLRAAPSAQGGRAGCMDLGCPGEPSRCPGERRARESRRGAAPVGAQRAQGRQACPRFAAPRPVGAESWRPQPRSGEELARPEGLDLPEDTALVGAHAQYGGRGARTRGASPGAGPWRLLFSYRSFRLRARSAEEPAATAASTGRREMWPSGEPTTCRQSASARQYSYILLAHLPHLH
ncbi:unnamed protein product [Lepidochelys olivacea]